MAVRDFDVIDRCVLLHEMLDGLLALVGFGAGGIFLCLFQLFNEFAECFDQHLSGNLAAPDCNGNDFCIYFILHGTLLSGA